MNEALLLKQLLDAMPSFVFAVDEDVRILQYNSAAAELLGAGQRVVLSRRGGEALHCIHSMDVPEGCGRANACRSCIIRGSVKEAFEGTRCARRRARMELKSGDKLSELNVLVTASPFVHEGQRMALLVLEDISEIVELQRIVPLCMKCKKVRDHAQFWSQVEAYFNRNWNVRFSHGYCPDCFQAELERLNKDGAQPASE